VTAGLQDHSAVRWLEPLRRTGLALALDDWALLARFEHDLTNLIDPVARDPQALGLRVDELDDSTEASATRQGGRSARLLAIKRALAARGYGALDVPTALGGAGHSPVLQLLVQFICGYRDLDQRDAATIGHGRLLIRHGTRSQLQRWLPRLLTGGLVGIAMTELHGGTQLRSITTTLVRRPRCTLLLTGEKCWVSRLAEAELFIVVCQDPGHGLSVVMVDRSTPGVTHHLITPGGLRGWSWGRLHFDHARLRHDDILGIPGVGAILCADHFAYCRPLVAATALGGAAAAVDQILARLHLRLDRGWIRAPRDSTLATIGRSVATIHAALLACITAVQLAASCDPAASTWGMLAKAHGVDAAYHVTTNLALLAGAAGFQAGSRLDKARRDLWGLQFADGIHEELYRAAGRQLLPTAHSSHQTSKAGRISRGAIPPAGLPNIPAALAAPDTARR